MWEMFLRGLERDIKNIFSVNWIDVLRIRSGGEFFIKRFRSLWRN